MRLKGQRPALICKSGHRISWLGARDETPRARRTDALALISTARRIPVLVGNDPVAYPGREVWDYCSAKSVSMGWDERRPSDDCCERLVDWLHRVIFPRNKCITQWVRHALPSCRSLPRGRSPCPPARACSCPTARLIMSSTYIPHHTPTSSDTSDAQASTGTGWPSIYAHEGDPPTHAPPAQRTMQAWFSNALTAKRASPHGRPRRSADGKGEGQALS